MKKYRKAVFIVTYRKEGEKILYLLLKRKLHWKGWEFPKGGIESDENLPRTVKRELKEETSQSPVKTKNYSLSGKYNYHALLKDRPGFSGQTWKLFSCEIKNKKIKIDKREHSGYKWLEFKPALKLLTWKNQRKCLRIVNSSVNNAPENRKRVEKS